MSQNILFILFFIIKVIISNNNGTIILQYLKRVPHLLKSSLLISCTIHAFKMRSSNYSEIKLRNQKRSVHLSKCSTLSKLLMFLFLLFLILITLRIRSLFLFDNYSDLAFESIFIDAFCWQVTQDGNIIPRSLSRLLPSKILVFRHDLLVLTKSFEKLVSTLLETNNICI